jgi:fibronectin type 3 domain-containing protein
MEMNMKTIDETTSHSTRLPAEELLAGHPKDSNQVAGYKLALVLLFSIAIASCGGGGGGGGTTTQTLSGTAAQGAAIASATITIKDKNGSTATGTTKADGTFTIDVTGKTAPFLLRISAGTGYLYSVSTASGTATVNIHPFTDLIVRNWYKVQGSDVDTEFGGTLTNIPTATDINTIEAVVGSILSTLLTNTGLSSTTFNLITSPFNADNTGFDKILDNTKVTVGTTGAVTVTATDATTGISGTLVSVNLTTNLTAADTTKPSGPTGLSAIPASATSVVLVWNASNDNVGVAGYNIYRVGSNNKIGTSPYPVYSDTGLTSGTNYCYQVEAIDGAGNISANKSSQVCATPAADTTTPSAPTNLTATVASAYQINLSWTASASTNVVGYAIYRGATKIAAVTGTSYSDTGLASSTPYSYTVKALSGALILSVASNAASTTTQAGYPSIPTGVTAAAGNGQVTISWNAVGGATSYNIYWSTTAGVTKTNGTKITGATSPYTHTGITNGTAYYYVVTAVNSLGESMESAQVSATPAAATNDPALIGTWVTTGSDAGGSFVKTLVITTNSMTQTDNPTNLECSGEIDSYTTSGTTLTATVTTASPNLHTADCHGAPGDTGGGVGFQESVTYSISGTTLTISTPGGVVTFQKQTGVSQFDGIYTGSYSGTVTTAGILNITVNNGVLTGTAAEVGSATLTGTVSASGAVTVTTITISGCPGVTATFTGQITGAVMTGTYSNGAGGSCVAETGTWTATLATGTHTASGTYTWNPTTAVVTWNWTASDFVGCDGPSLGTGTDTGVTITATTMTNSNGDTWTRSSGTAGDIAGTWTSTDSTTGNSYTLTTNANGTVSMTGVIVSISSCSSGVKAEAQHWSSGYLVSLRYSDQNKTATSVTVTGPGITGSVSPTGTGVSQFDGTYTGNWSISWDNASGTFTTTLANGVFTGTVFTTTSGNHGISEVPLISGTVSSSGAIAITGADCSGANAVTFTGQITTTLSGGAGMTMTYSRAASTTGACGAESGTITATLTSTALTYHTGMGSWGSGTPESLISFGTTYPTGLPFTYTFTITDATGTWTATSTVSCFEQQFVSSISPTGTVSGTPTFSWTGINDPSPVYGVGVNDPNGNGLWANYFISGTSIVYGGPALTSGATYGYVVSVQSSSACNNPTSGGGSYVAGSFTY